MIISRMNRTDASGSRRLVAARRPAFTLIELLVVITIVLIISAVALPTVLPALSHRQVSEAARILQGALVGARDAAIHNNAPSGIRLLPDPAFLTRNGTTGIIDPTQPLASNRIVPIDPAPPYTEGLINVNLAAPLNTTGVPSWTPPSYPFDAYGTEVYPVTLYAPDTTGKLTIPVNPNFGNTNGTFANANVLMIEEAVIDKNGLPSNPTSWYWNIRVGDKIQINNSGLWYTVIGPQVVSAASGTGNPEQFVNVGPPGTASTLFRPIPNSANYVYPEYLLVVNGVDDNNNGWTDEGYDGVDNDGQLINKNLHTDDLIEWEYESWPTTISPSKPIHNAQYSIQRRPAPSTNAREISLPSDVVVDLTTSFYASGTTSQTPNVSNPSRERSRLPVNLYSGYVDILINPNGTVVPTTTTFYSSPTSANLGGNFYHFWLSERADVQAPNTALTTAPYLPIGLPPGTSSTAFGAYTLLKGDYRLVTLFTRSGQIESDEDMQFDNPLTPANGTYNTNYPFLGTQLGITGGP